MDYNWLIPKAQMRQTPGKGSGSFAITKIKKGEVVASFGGFVVDEAELKNHSEDRVARSLQLVENTYLLSGLEPEPGDMLTDPQKVFDNAEEMAARYKQMLLEQADESETDSLVEEETAELD